MSRVIPTLVLLGAFSLWSAVSTAQPLAPETSNRSAVTLKVTPTNVKGDAWEFEMVFDTHSQELKDDLLKTAVLVTPDGKQIAPAGWKGDAPGGHHRKGVLRFDAVKPQPGKLELRVTRPGEQEPRIFTWELK